MSVASFMRMSPPGIRRSVQPTHEPAFYTHFDLDGFEAAFAPLVATPRAAWIEENEIGRAHV